MGTKTCTHNLCSEQNLKIHLKIIIFTIVKIAVLRRLAIVKCLNHIVRKGNFSIPPGETFSKHVLIDSYWDQMAGFKLPFECCLYG